MDQENKDLIDLDNGTSQAETGTALAPTDAPTDAPTGAPSGAATAPAYVSAVSLLGGERDGSVRIIVERDTSVPLESFTLSYRLAGIGKDGAVADSRFFSLLYSREGLNSKERIAVRVKAPDGYRTVGCTAYISKIEYSGGKTDSFSFGDDGVRSASCTLEGVVIRSPEDRKKLSRGRRLALIAIASVVGGALIVFGGIRIAQYSGMKNSLAELVNAGRYGEAYKIAEESDYLSLEKSVGGNIIKKCLNERDYKTAYVYGVASGKEKTVFKRVEYEIENSGSDVFTTDAFAVLKKLTNDEEYDGTIKNFIKKSCERGDYSSAVYAAGQLRSASERNLTRRNMIVEGVCYYAESSAASGSDKLEIASEFFAFHQTGNATTDASVASEIVGRCISKGYTAAAVVLSSHFSGMFEEFEYSPESIKITPDDPSIARSADCAYALLTDEQKRAYHASVLAASEEVFVVNGSSISKLDITDAVSVATYENRTAVLHSNGAVSHVLNGGHNTVSEIPGSVNAVQIAVGLEHTVILNSDGTVAATGDNSLGQCNVSSWSDIVKIAAGRYFTIGLRADGTVVACGSDRAGQCEVSGFNNVVSIEACDQTAVLLFDDGTVGLVGSLAFGLQAAEKFTNVEQIKAGGSTVIAKLADGTFAVADGSVSGGAIDVSGWDADNISAFAAGSQFIAYTDKKGRINTIGDGAPNS